MKKLFIVLVCLVIVTQQVDPKTKIYKENKGTYALSNVNGWKDYPELKINVELAEAQLAAVGYVITIGSSGATHLVTRLLVDNAEAVYYRAISGNTVYHTNAVNGHVYLNSGKHEITVQYRTPGSVSSSPADWTTAQLQVVY